MNAVWASQFDKIECNQAISQWVAYELFGGAENFGPCCTMGVFDKRDMVAAVVYHNYHPSTGVIELSAASKTRRWLARNILQEMFNRPFKAMHCQALVFRTDPDHNPLHKMLTAVGATRYILPRLRGRNKDEAVFVLTDDDWNANKFNRRSSEHGQISTEAA